MMRHFFFLLVAVLCSEDIACGQFQMIPAPVQTKRILILNATAHLGNGQVIENSAIGFSQGKLDLVADARVIRLNMSAYDTIIQASGLHVYPGFIAMNTTLGLHETDAVRADDDIAEVGKYHPEIRSLIAYNTDSEIIPTVRSNGILLAQIVPRDAAISGTSCVVQLDAWNWEDAVISAEDGVHLNWPLLSMRKFEKGKSTIEVDRNYLDERTEIEKFFKDARAYCSANTHPIADVRYEAMRKVFTGQMTLYVHADETKALREIIAFKKAMNVPSVVIIGGNDSPLVADLLREANIAVVVGRTHGLPVFNDDAVDRQYRLPSVLHELGVSFALQNEGPMERMNLRNLPFNLGSAVAQGLPYEEAVRALTLTPATLLHIEKRYGSLEPGKSATLFISSGDALNSMTNQVQKAFIDGRMIDLRSKQTELYHKYQKKYGFE